MTLMTKFLSAAATGLALAATSAVADPALIYDLGGKFDKSFNEAAFNGATKWAEDTGGSFKDIEITSEAQREQALRGFAEKGFNPVITTGFSFSTPIANVAADYPDINFVTIDGFVDPAEHPNVLSVLFSEAEGSYLVGMLAGMESKTGTVSFVGGMDIPLIRKFACGYAQGAKAVNPDIKVISNMTGTDPSAWNDPVKGSELTKAQVDQGSDVIFAAAGATGLGVLQTAADNKVFGIGVDSNQNYLHPGNMLTSMLKRVDLAVADAMTAGADLETGVHVLGLAQDGVGYAMDEYNADLITEEMKAAVEDAKAKIISGEILVHDYTADDTCPALSF
ncbi:BMP family lipoprotein [Pseudooceanicola spongiae]|jgi:basic membrane protein A and related proteins|uniref:BMP family ABC transporter substrate-binding protein n=1 Tax=Pseudooceanicola spongiae TaxID=2613965 RepID=A0A7L9WQ70_9RHOB|nr:BMP family ABC transporter substrate-binding protein [Pseudooceanicola spongiae]QOL81586.1 BMP family ABC transporter substrate-binding protein [Pseudooceanicola spongiae]|tara:strand:- start:32 stop:1039 length:1008 start_codon:yes stop_codon:yes gene_type:complete